MSFLEHRLIRVVRKGHIIQLNAVQVPSMSVAPYMESAGMPGARGDQDGTLRYDIIQLNPLQVQSMSVTP